MTFIGLILPRPVSRSDLGAAGLWNVRRAVKYAEIPSKAVDFDVVIEQDSTGAFLADVPVLPGCHSWGTTKEEALRNVTEAIALYLEVQGHPTTRVVAIEKVRVEG